MIAKIALAAVLTSLAIVAVGCAPGEDGAGQDEEVASSTDALQNIPYCESEDHKLGLNVALTGKSMQDGPVTFTFSREGKTRTANDAVIRLEHPDGSWVDYRTPDNLVDNVAASPELLVAKSSSKSKGVSTKLNKGDILQIVANFDIKGKDEIHCRTTLRL